MSDSRCEQHSDPNCPGTVALCVCPGPADASSQERDEVIARAFHEAYERLAPDFNYRTRDVSAVPWSMVPQANRRLMRATVMALLNDGTIR